MKNIFTLKSLKSKSLIGKLSVPGDKSISIRALLISSLCFGNTKITNLLESDDVCETSYKDREGKYQGQKGVTLPKT